VESEKIDIFLPNRIGDVILTLPSLACIKQLQQQYASAEREYRLISHFPMAEIVKSLNLFPVVPVSFAVKIMSWLYPPDKAFFLSTTTKNFGYRSVLSHGLRMPNKKHIRYSVNLPYLSFPYPETSLPAALVQFLRSEFGFSSYTVRHFGLCLQLGFTVEQIRRTFRFDAGSLSFPDGFYDWQPPFSSRYLVFCMEAASGRKKNNADRRWKEDYFLDLAQLAYEKYSMHAAFIGISNIPELPKKPYFHDFRGKLSLKQTALLLHFSCGYVGNDTGPLHLSNLMKKNSIGIYLREVAFNDYGPLFPQLTAKFLRPKRSEEIYPALDRMASLVNR
jgi:ADP-heptose:LPS heptosyltransferase